MTDTEIEQGSPYPFLSEIAQIRRRARQHIADGAASVNYAADRAAADRAVVLRLLNESLATELVCVLRYRRHYFMASGSVAEASRGEFLKHSQEEQQHADQLAERIVQLGGEPNFSPRGMVDRSHSEYADDDSLADMVEEDLIAERIAIESYREIIQYIGEQDTTTRSLFESILAAEEEHTEELASMRADLMRTIRGSTAANGTPTQPGELR
jgi:bacterioferritin